MQEDFKENIYQKYYSYHTKHLYGTVTLASIKKQFKSWKYYFSEYLPENKNIKILDAGCGYGGFTHWLNESGFNNTTGLDISKELIEIGHSLNIKNIVEENIFNYLENNYDTYDIIFCRDVLEHLKKEEVFNIFQLFKNALKENGKLVIQVPNGFSKNFGKIFYSDFTHETIFSEATLNQISFETGFKNLTVKEVTPVPKSLISSVRYVFWQLLKLKYKFIQLIETGSSDGLYSQNIIARITK
ncbi:MAG: hypothetical protein B6D44_00530 [Ignavibacteriales bacterium UTCHB2]|jgi:2-polyprenyl-3-methyl-5-hydroxy-6-metoxy-1,4-benzoquinol methylase|nr:MAG: hypothetical protein B6D44_00530 [Ignavibacteriales bacterium UTCHB2]